MPNFKEQQDLFAQQESQLSMKSQAFVELFTKRGLIEAGSIQNEAVRRADKTKRRNMRHNTLALLKSYRDIQWMLRCFPDTIAEELDAPLHDLDALIQLVSSEIDWGNQKVESRMESIRRSRLMMDQINKAISILRNKPGNGELLYNLIYLTYVALEKLMIAEICAQLHVSDRQNYRLRQQALNISPSAFGPIHG